MPPICNYEDHLLSVMKCNLHLRSRNL